jgi:hypothetical protein
VTGRASVLCESLHDAYAYACGVLYREGCVYTHAPPSKIPTVHARSVSQGGETLMSRRGRRSCGWAWSSHRLSRRSWCRYRNNHTNHCQNPYKTYLKREDWCRYWLPCKIRPTYSIHIVGILQGGVHIHCLCIVGILQGGCLYTPTLRCKTRQM